MYVPVAILRDMRRDGTASVVPAQPVVFVVENVVTVSFEPIGQFRVSKPLAHELKGLAVILPDCPSCMIMDFLLARSSNTLSRAALEVRLWTLVGQFSGAGGSAEFRQ